MSFEAIHKDIIAKKFKPIYFFCGEEVYFIDILEQALLDNALEAHEKDFNLDVFYAKDIEAINILNAANQYPSFAERRIVLVREAQDFKAKVWEDLEHYFNKPVSSTILIFCHKHKTLDKRLKISKLIEKNSTFFIADKIKEEQLPKWIEAYVHQQQLKISSAESNLLAENLGNDLSRISNELEKLKVVLPNGAIITKEVIEKWIGISKEYNLTEMNKAIIQHDFAKAIKIALYFEHNPKAGSIIAVIAFLYPFFSRLLLYHTNKSKSDAELRSLGLYYLQDYKLGIKYYSPNKTIAILHLINEFDAKAKGLYASNNTSDANLLKELIYKIMH
jgi:DNA polymerase-3 subunit delta